MKKLVYPLVITIASISMLAQQPPARTADQAQAAAAQPLPPDAASREQVLKLFDVLQLKKTMDLMMSSMMQQSKANAALALRQSLPDLTPEEQKAFADMLDDSFKDAQSMLKAEELMEATIPVYQRHLTNADIDAILAFYSSPAGQKYLREQPQMVQESIEAVGPIQQRLMLQMTDKINERIKQMIDTMEKQQKEKQQKAKPANSSTPPKSSH